MKRHNNVTIRKNIVANRGYVCEMCGYAPKDFGFLDLHHIISVQFWGNDTEKNLILLCEKCHMDAHGFEKRTYLDKDCELWHKEHK